MNPATSPSVPQDLAFLARQTAAAVARWTFGCMALAVVIKLALAGG